MNPSRSTDHRITLHLAVDFFCVFKSPDHPCDRSYAWAVQPRQRSDKRPDRVEIAPEQLVAAVELAEKLKEVGARGEGSYSRVVMDVFIACLKFRTVMELSVV